MKPAIFIMAHGAGADSNSLFMQQMVQLITNHRITVVNFDFPYMIRRQQTGKKSPPDRMPKLIDAFKEQIDKCKRDYPANNIFIGGKSMGGRVASLIADETNVEGLICLGYPFHPPGKPENLRTQHLESLNTSTLIVQGSRDMFGKPDEVNHYRLSKNINIEWIEDGNHSLETLKRSKMTTEQSWRLAAHKIQQFILSHAK